MQKWQLPHGSHTSWASGWILQQSQHFLPLIVWLKMRLFSSRFPRKKQRIRFLHGRLRLLNLRKSKTSSRVRNASNKISEESELSSFDENRVMRSAVPRLFKVCIGKNQITWKALEPVTSGADNITKNSFVSSFLSVFLYGTPIHIKFTNYSYRSM